MHRIAIVAVIAAVSATATADAADADSVAKEYAAKWKAHAKTQLPMLVQRLAMVKKAAVNRRLKRPFVRNAKTGRFVFGSKKTKASLVSRTRLEIISLHDTGPPFVNAFPKTGEVGGLMGMKSEIRVMQVIGKKTMLAHLESVGRSYYLAGKVRTSGGGKVLYWFEMDTEDFVDGQYLSPLPNRVLFVSGTKTYRTGGGGTDTVKVLTDITGRVMKFGPFSKITSTKELDEYLAKAKARPQVSNDARASRALAAIESLIDRGKKESAKTHLKRLIAKYPKTKAAAKAKAILGGIE